MKRCNLQWTIMFWHFHCLFKKICHLRKHKKFINKLFCHSYNETKKHSQIYKYIVTVFIFFEHHSGFNGKRIYMYKSLKMILFFIFFIFYFAWLKIEKLFWKSHNVGTMAKVCVCILYIYIYTHAHTLLHKQDATQGNFFFFFFFLVEFNRYEFNFFAIPRLKSLVCPTIYL